MIADPVAYLEENRQPYIVNGNTIDLMFHKHQWRAWDSTKRFVLILAGTQGGKALALDTPIPTPDGYKPMGDIVAGDVVFDENGKPCNVTRVTGIQHNRDCYKILFDDGVEIIADADHQWWTQTYLQRKNLARRVPDSNPSYTGRPQCQPRPDFTVSTTLDIKSTVKDRRGANNHSIPLAGAVDYEEKEFIIQPYSLGAWLGDGTSRSGKITTMDLEVLEGLNADGYTFDKIKSQNAGKATTYIINRTKRGGVHTLDSFQAKLRAVGVLGNKHIPEEYFLGSAKQRLKLLQGLMDTDGSVTKGTKRECEFSSKNELLALGVVRLAQTLGIKPRLKSKSIKFDGKDAGEAYIVKFTTDVPVFTIKRKLSRLEDYKKRSDTKNRYVVSVEPVDSVPVKCIEVDSPNHVYLCGHAHVPTHNTTFGPLWLWREIQNRGAGDYLVVTPTYPMLIKKCLPEFKRLFENVLKLGKYVGGDKKIFTFSKDGELALFGQEQDVPTQVFFGHAQDPDSLESSTAKGAWLDECGQKKFKLDSFNAIMRRLSIHVGRVLMTTTPYYIGWLKHQFWDAWQEAKGKHPHIDVIRFKSIDNPAFPQEEYELAKSMLPPWKFDMFYNALFTRPAGLIYDSFDPDKHTIKRFAIPKDWPRYLGLDFGGVNTAGTFWAKDPKADRYYCYREYKAGGRTAKEHAEAMLEGEPEAPICYGGAKSEGQWREEFGAGGLPVHVPEVSEVEVGINRVYGGFKQDQLYIFHDLDDLLDELGSYSRELDDEGQATEKIENKNSYHKLDSVRYIGSHFLEGAGELYGGTF